jgi:hypothetical protein
MAGNVTSQTEVSGITTHGFWLLLDDEELFVPFEQFPWFRSASVEKIFHVEHPQPHHLYWPELDVDLDIASIKQPDLFPLISR